MTPSPPSQTATLVDLLRGRSLERSEREVFTFLDDGETPSARLTFAQLDARARAIAARLAETVEAGERALLLFPPGLEFISAFFGCLYAGVIAVPTHLPSSRRPDPRLHSILADAAPRVVLTTEGFQARMERIPELRTLHCLITDQREKERPDAWEAPQLSGETLAFLQYTSGSTGTPKGVEVTHANLLSNEEAIRRVFAQSEASVVVSWLPFYHDMGLIGGILQPIYSGGRCLLLPPVAFLQRPIRWLRAISEHRATTSGGPNFAYELCLRKVTAEEREGLDLSSWEVAFNGAEPVRAATLERFSSFFAPCGFRRRAFLPCYGLAEATLLVTGGSAASEPTVECVSAAALEQDQRLASPPRDGRRLVSSGRPAAGDVLITEAKSGRPCPPGGIGEIRIAGPGVTRGYWNRPDETARLKSRVGDKLYLHTGDLGFLAKGELFVTGRLKDLIILRGRNLYPQDIEETVERAAPGLRPGSGAAFSVDVDDQERLVVVQELVRNFQGDTEEVAKAVRQAVAEVHEAQVHALVLVRVGAVPKTSSGKIRRSHCRSLFLAGELPVLAESVLDEEVDEAAGFDARPGVTPEELRGLATRRESLEGYLRRQVAQLARILPDDIRPEEPLTRWGLDSLNAIELQSSVEDTLGVVLPMTAFLEGQTLREIAAELDRSLGNDLSRPVASRPDDATAESRGAPLSHGQEALWFLECLAPESTAYNIAAAARVSGGLDPAALGVALRAFVARHSALRTSFTQGPNGPRQHVHPEVEIECTSEDATDWSAEQLSEVLEREAHRPFELDRAPLLRLRILRRGEDEVVLLLVVHHIVSDFWSLAVLVEELGALYSEAAGGPKASLEPLPCTYLDFVSHERRQLAGEEGQRLQRYWEERLRGVPRVLELPADRPRPVLQTYRGGSRSFVAQTDLAGRLKALGQTHGATLYMTWMAAFQTLLHRYTGQRTIAVGSPSAGRQGRTFSRVFGYFVNPVVVVGEAEGNPTFGDFLGRIRQSVLGALAHQEYPFSLLTEQLQPQRDPSRSPIFQAMLVHHNAQRGDAALSAFAAGEEGVRLEMAGLVLSSLRLAEAVQHDVVLTTAQRPDGFLSARLHYNRDLFDATTADRMLGHLHHLLTAAAAAPGECLSALPLLGRAERHQLLREWNDPARSHPALPAAAGSTLPSLLAARVARTPDAVAVVEEERHLTYGELDRRAERLAHALRHRGVAPDVVVGLCCVRSLEMVVGLWAVLKAGGAYLPLDPALPDERLAFMIQETRALVLTPRALLAERGTLLGDAPRGTLCLDDETPAHPPERAAAVFPENLAYVLYTSGSTGRPKAVAVSHRSVVNHARHMAAAFALGHEDRVLQFASLSFDVAAEELFPTWLAGGRVVLRSPASEGSLMAFTDFVERQRLTVMNLPSSFWQTWTAELLRSQRPCPATLRLVVAGSEAVPASALADWRRLGDGRPDWLNAYGLTETTITATVHRPGPGESPPGQTSVAIGRAVCGLRTYLLDQNLCPVPPGAPGELCLAGAALARGYLGRPALTASRFRPDPFSERPGERLYPTGDLGRFSPGGELQLSGRIDQQVKIRGFRVELGEIEATLTRHRSVRQAVVVTRDDSSAGSRLVAYLVPEGEVPPETVELQDFLRRSLPEHMVPTVFVPLQHLPLRGDKVDRRALPAPPAESTTAAYEKPRSPAEALLADLFGELLGRPVGIHDDFFELGGHSLLATQLVARLRRPFGVELGVREVFAAPNVAALAERIERERQGSHDLFVTPPVRPSARRAEDGLPLSFAQERLWFLDQLEPGQTAYNVPAAMRIEGRLEPAWLQASLDEVVRRHEILRTSFANVAGQAVQVIAPSAAYALPLVDLRSLPPELRVAEARRLAATEARRKFDLGRGPLLRTTLLRLARHEHTLLLTMHHIVCDGWSFGVLFRELGVLYGSLAAGRRASPLPTPKLQYADFACWQRQWLRGEMLAAQLGYWREQLAGAPLVLDLPTDRPRPAVLSERGGSVPVVVPAEVYEGLIRLGRRHGATFYMILLAGFAELLGRYSGQRDLLLGAPVANRNRAELESLIGFFVNTLALRVRRCAESFPELLAAVREATLDAYAHQHLPFEKLVEALQPERNTSRAPLVQVLCVLQNAPADGLELPGLRLSLLEAEQGTAKLDLLLSLSEEGGAVGGTLEHSRDLFDATTVRRLAGHLTTLLSEAAADPDRPPQELPVLPAAERHQLLEWNDTATAHPPRCLHELFEDQVARTPGATALVSGHRELTYEELDRRARQLAHRLRELGVAPEMRVGVCLERTPEMVVSLLAILKAGAAYVPLDPAYPAARLAFMLEDSGASVLITDGEAGIGVPEGTWIVDPQVPEELGEPPAGATPPHREHPDRTGHLAYIIYTSGSTGRPKGVAVEHRSASALLGWARRTYPPQTLRGVLFSTSICFDLSIFELFLPLSTGGTAILVRDALALAEPLPAVDRVTLLNTVPSAATELLRRAAVPPSVEIVNLAGEPLERSLAEDLLALPHVASVYNLYGPSEDTTYSTGVELTGPLAGAPTIGRPLTGTKGWVLDAELRLLPAGVPGELVLSGDGLARGYYKRPALSAERFIPDAWSGAAGRRAYRTGDRVRHRHDGELEFLGRLDHQVKVRGFRIELGEIEAALLAHPGVGQAAATVRLDTGDPRLVAYVVASAETAPAEAELRALLGRSLPAYMVPGAIVELDRLPLTPNGKLDRKALPAPPAPKGAAPQGPVEELLAAIYGNLLGTERVGRSDNFFELGGHSLLATRLHSQLRDVFRVDLPLRSLFEAPTVAGLAELVSQGPHDTAEPPIVAVARDGKLPLSFAQERLWFLDRLEGGSSAYNMSDAIRLRGRLDVGALTSSLAEVVRRHESLRTSFVGFSGGVEQTVSAQVEVTVPVIDLQRLAPPRRRRTARRLTLQEAQRPFDLKRAPLLVLRLLRLAPEEHLALFNIHHIVADGWSLGILLGELGEIYRAVQASRPPRLPALAVQYADYASWQRRWLQGEVLDRELKYWRASLADAPTTLELPTDQPRPAVRSSRGASEPLFLPAARVRQLREAGSAAGATLYMTLLAGFATFLHRLSHKGQLLIASPIANRTQAVVEGVIGCFVNTLVLHADLRGRPTFHALLDRLREVTLGAYAHQQLPFEKLVEELDPERDLSYTPLVQVMLVLNNAPRAEITIPGLELTPLDEDNATAKFDLTLTLTGTTYGLVGSLEYDRDLFDPTTVRRWRQQLETLLAAAADHPSQTLCGLDLLTTAERHQLLEWNDTAAPPEAGRLLLHQTFEAQAAATPDAVALIDGERSLTYRELDRQANHLAQRLRALDVGPETPVAICLERSVEMVVSLLATLKAGGAYVPVDPQYPEARRSFMLEDCAAPVVLAPEGGPAPPGARVLTPRLAEPARLTGQESPPPSAARLTSLAYVIYTSGSTGRPKGVAIEHRSAVELVEWARSFFGPEPLRGVLFSTSICFDLSIFELFAPLATGGTVILAENALALPRLPARERVSLINTVPSAIAELLHLRAIPPSVRTVNLAGEPLKPHLVEALYRLPHVERVLNLYGPSEDTTYSTVASLAPGIREVPIGRPLTGTEVRLLDATLAPVPIGVAGEVCLAGAGLARGYWRRPAQVAAAFVPDPGARVGGARLYRTGDLARYRPAGDLDFLGRIDHQVKIRGFRIELGEVEAMLLSHPAVQEATVLARRDLGDDARLVAYVVPAAAGGDPEGLRAFAAEKLPSYMVPAHVVELQAFPLLPNGKIDRKALPAPALPAASDARAARPLREPLAELLASVYSQLLNVEDVGPTESFFALGGHSLLAARLSAMVAELCQVELPVRTIFENPTIAELTRAISRLRRGDALPPLVPGPSAETYPLSMAQERLWFLHRLDPRSPTYNLPAALRLRGRFAIPLLAAAIRTVTERHETLRTTVAEDGESGVVQRIAPAPAAGLDLVDLRGLAAERHESTVLRLGRAFAEEPFDLARGPLVRWCLLMLGEREHVLLVTLHHIIADGWSVAVLTEELITLYRGLVLGEPAALPALAVRYGDFARWQRRVLTAERLAPQIESWRRRLAAVPALELPTDRPRPAQAGREGATLPVALPKALSARLVQLSRRMNVTLFMTLQAGFTTFLARCSGQNDFAVGTPIAQRQRHVTEDLIGFFVNTLVLRSTLSADPAGTGFPEPTLRQLLVRVRERTLEAYENQDVPFERLVEELDVERNLSRTPFFQVMLVLQNTPGVTVDLPELTLEPLSVDSGTAKYDLTLELFETPDGLRGSLEYRRDLFDRTTLVRWTAHLETLLAAAAEDPDRRLGQLPWLDAAQRHQLLAEWGCGGPGYDDGLPLHRQLETWVRRTPHQLAVEAGSRSLTYAELDRQASVLAGRLRRLGVTAEHGVGLAIGRSPEAVVGLLATLKAGGFYVPLDPDYPEERLRFLLADSRVRVVLVNATADGGELARIAGQEGLQLVDLGAGTGDEPPAALPEVDPGQLAYLIYTSGSTGRPKGVAVTHRSVSRLVLDTRYVTLAPADKVALASTLSFDAATFEIWGALLNGATLVALPPGRLSLRDLGREVRRRQVSVLWLTAGLFRQMVDVHLEDLAGVRCLLAGGDVLPVEQVRRVRRELPDTRLVNGYGPTEGTTFTCCHPVAGTEVVFSVPIGRPIDGTDVFVLDREMQPVPPGVFGELMIGGLGLARGYFDRPRRTAETFVPHPLSPYHGDRLYLTGDQARFTADGLVEFRGRLDSQVKVRGFRVELGEVETVLAQHPALRQAVVLAREDVPGDQRLFAYVVPEAPADGGADTLPAELRIYARTRLPDYMVPSAFLVLAELPLNPNGKVDRAALGRLAAPAVETGVSRALKTPTEELVAELYREVLDVEQVDAGSDFFELGGHSLLATRLVSRLEQLFGVDIDLHRLFEAPGIEALAAVVERARRLGASDGVTLRPVPRDAGALPLSFAQERLWFLDQLDPGKALYNVPLAMLLEGELDVALLRFAFTRLIERHETLRTRFATGTDGRPVQWISPAAGLQIPITDLSRLDADARQAEARRLTTAEERWPFDLGRGPLLRLRLLRFSPREHVAVLVLHHIVCDGWSLGVLLRDLKALYDRGPGTPLPALVVQYADYAVWQRQWLAGETLEANIAYWRRELGTVPKVLSLPSDRPRRSLAASTSAVLPVELPAALAGKLRQVSRRGGATLYMTLLGAFALVLSRSAGQRELLLGSPIAGRTRTETEDLIGFFVNTLVLRADLRGRPSFLALLGRLRETTLGAYAHQELPFEKLVEELVPGRDLSRPPLVQVMLAHQNVPLPDLELPGLRWSPLPSSTASAKFELTLSLDESLSGALHYRPELFDATTIQRWSGHLSTLLSGIAADPVRSIEELPLLSPAERHQLLAWNDTTVVHGEASLLHHRIAAAALAHPDAVAVVCGEREVSYRELEAQAERLARHLRSFGVGPERCVAVCLERSVELVLALLATLKAGGAYLPLDPTYPDSRLQLMLTDSRAQLLVSTQELAAGLGTAAGALPCPLFALEEGWEGTPTSAVEDAGPPRVFPESPAYVLYTSGSTGRPKGTVISHASICNHLSWMQSSLPLGPEDRMLQKTSLSFDAAGSELWPPLAAGARLVLAPPEAQKDPALLIATVLRHRITVLHLVPTQLRMLLGQPAFADCRSLRRVDCGGEALDAPLWEGLSATLPRAELVNLYGPTEATIHATYAVFRPEDRTPGISIGRPIHNAQAYVLDPGLREVPQGAPGELFLAGAGLARGYLARPGRSAESFLPNPFGEAGSRLYASGDRVHRLADGRLEYLGRRDEQVKLRGLRIELGEIEEALKAHPQITDAVVLLQDAGTRLVACVTGGSVPPVGDLRAFLAQMLPEPMVPSSWVPLEAMPLLPNGKVDRARLKSRLPVSASDRQGLETRYQPPRTPTERRVAALWSEVLGVERPGIDDNFFELGGHSLSATQLVVRLREAFDLEELPLSRLFQEPTIAQLAAAITELQAVREGEDETRRLLEELEGLSQEEVLALLEMEIPDEEVLQ